MPRRKPCLPRSTSLSNRPTQSFRTSSNNPFRSPSAFNKQKLSLVPGTESGGLSGTYISICDYHHQKRFRHRILPHKLVQDFCLQRGTDPGHTIVTTRPKILFPAFIFVVSYPLLGVNEFDRSDPIGVGKVVDGGNPLHGFLQGFNAIPFLFGLHGGTVICVQLLAMWSEQGNHEMRAKPINIAISYKISIDNCSAISFLHPRSNNFSIMVLA